MGAQFMPDLLDEQPGESLADHGALLPASVPGDDTSAGRPTGHGPPLSG